MRLGIFATMWKHMRENAFISATAFAALVHSTWTLGTMFAGMQPTITAAVGTAAFWPELVKSLAWHAPAFAIAFSLDVGQVVTSADLRRGEKTQAKYAVFFIFAVATFYLQMIYMVAHVPHVPLGTGVASWMREFVQTSVDHAILIIPFLLPASTLLYTFSYGDASHGAPPVDTQALHYHQDTHMHVHQDTPPAIANVSVAPPAPKALPTSVRTSPRGNANGEAAAMVHASDDGTYTVRCDLCGYEKTGYATEGSALGSAAGHIGRHCKVRNAYKMQDVPQSVDAQ